MPIADREGPSLPAGTDEPPAQARVARQVAATREPPIVAERAFNAAACIDSDPGAIGELGRRLALLNTRVSELESLVARTIVTMDDRLAALDRGIKTVDTAAPAILAALERMQQTSDQLRATARGLTTDAAKMLSAPVLEAVDDTVERLVTTIVAIAKGGVP